MTLLELVAERFNFVVIIVLMMIGLYIVFASSNLIKRLIGLAVFQTSVGLFYISMGKVTGGRPPILDVATGAAVTAPSPAPAGIGALIPGPVDFAPAGAIAGVYANPLPHVLILTAIVVSVSTLAVGLALAVRIREAYGAIEEEDLQAADREAEHAA